MSNNFGKTSLSKESFIFLIFDSILNAVNGVEGLFEYFLVCSIVRNLKSHIHIMEIGAYERIGFFEFLLLDFFIIVETLEGAVCFNCFSESFLGEECF